jgi:hypothetical protein
MYKIRHRKTGLFAKGGQRVSWSKKGKIWSERGHLSNHFALFSDPVKAYEGAEIIESDMVIQGIVSISDWSADVLQRRNKREDSRRKWYEEQYREVRRKQFEVLKREFE